MFFKRLFQCNKKSDHLKYPKIKLDFKYVIFDVVREHIENDDFPEESMGEIGGIDGWYIKMKVDTERNKIYPFIYCPEKPELLVRTYTSILKKDEGYVSGHYTNYHLKSNHGVIGFKMKIDELLDEKNGYLKNDGEISIEYGIQVASIKGEDGVWKYNFNDKLFDWEEMKNTIVFYHCGQGRSYLFCHKQLWAFQSKSFNLISNERQIIRNENDNNFEVLERCLQIAHGVRIQVSPSYEWFSIIKLARKYSLSNVIHYCEQQLIEKHPVGCFESAIHLKLNRYLAQSLKTWKSVEELKTVLGHYVEIDKMSGEAMKQCVKYILDNSN